MRPADFDPPYGVAETLMPQLRRIVASNPSPMTFRGTNTYLLGDREIAVIDPGPAHKDHLAAILSAIKPRQQITHIIVSHAHLDHSPLASRLSEETGAPILAFGDAEAGRSHIMQQLKNAGYEGGGEGVDHAFTPDILLNDGERIRNKEWELEVMHTPGHLGNHICLGWGAHCFTADLVMGWSSSLVSPPDGDLSDFMLSCQRLLQTDWRKFFPGHGAPVDQPQERVEWLIHHRKQREKEIIAALKDGHVTAPDITAVVYQDTPQTLWPAAERNVLAHLIDLLNRSLVELDGNLERNSRFSWIDTGTQ